jgi:glycosyltransferase involved in cell wall biosynthesis
VTARSILIVCHYYPPSAGAAVQRPLSMAKYLRRMGYRVTVLTTGAFGALPDDSDQGVVRTYDLQLLQARLRGERRATPILEADTYSNRPHPLSYLLVPEALVLAWAPFAIAAALRLQWRERFDCVITTSPPESGHLAGYLLKRMGAAWIADVRDGWVFESYRPPWRTKLQERADSGLERTLMRAADVVTCVAKPLADYFRSILGANAVVVTNGWDPELLPDTEPPAANAAADLLDSERVSLVHAGRLEVVGRDPTPLIEALASLAREDPDTAARIELVFAGSFTPRELGLFARDVSPARIVAVGNLPRRQALELERAADGLVLVTAGTRSHEVTGKLFEYLGVGRPILALADGTEAGRIVRDAGAGLVIPTRDRAAARAGLERFARGEIAAPAEGARRAYSYPAVAERMAEQVESITRRAAGAPRAARGTR